MNEGMNDVFKTDRKGNYTNEWMNDVFKTDRKGNYTNEWMNEWCLQNRSKR